MKCDYRRSLDLLNSYRTLTTNNHTVSLIHTVYSSVHNVQSLLSLLFSPVVDWWRFPTMYSTFVLTFLPAVRVKSQSYFTTGGLPPVSSSRRQTPWDSRLSTNFQVNSFGRSPYVTSSLDRGCVCCLQLLLVLASAVILRFESRGIHDHILLCQIRDFPNLEGQVPVFVYLRNRVVLLCHQVLGSLFVASYVSQGYGGGIRTRLHTGSWSYRLTTNYNILGTKRAENTFPLLMFYCCLVVRPENTIPLLLFAGRCLATAAVR
jgi:hypothetical protein